MGENRFSACQGAEPACVPGQRAMTAIHPLRLRLSNAYLLVGDHRPILVDTGSPGDERKIEAACAAVGVNPRDFALIVHTHVHSDHFGTTAHFAALARCPVCYHEDDRELAAQGHNGSLRGVGLRGRLMAPLFARTPFKSVPADLPATEGRRLDDFGVAATLLHTPGHTRGSISIVLDDSNAIVGDVLMGGYAGGRFRPGKPNFHYFAHDPALAMRSLDRLLTMTRGKLHVGHGGPLTHADVTRWRMASTAG